MPQTNIVIVGAGVSGLTAAYLLCKNPNYNVTVVAKHMPGDYDIEYASPWAGANFFPQASPGTKQEQHERVTWKELARLAKDVPEAGIHFQDALIYRREKDSGTAVGQWFNELCKQDAWFKDLVPNFQPLVPSSLPPGYTSGTTFTSVCINPAIYLPYLVSQCLASKKPQHPSKFRIHRGVLTHVSDALSFLPGPSDKNAIIINCSGLSSKFLGGVEDEKMYAARGQIVVVRNEVEKMCTVSGTDDGPEEAMYVMGRAAGGGTILGGCLQRGNWSGEVDGELAGRIMRRCVEICPGLVKGREGVEGLSVVRHGVGLRPGRDGGVRVERERMGKTWVVHNYGHGGYGYQTSFGCAEEVVRLVEGIVQEKAKF